jgi:hypothetical protein
MEYADDRSLMSKPNATRTALATTERLTKPSVRASPGCQAGDRRR